MEAKQILKQIENPHGTINIGGENIVVEIKTANIKAGYSVDEIMKEMSKASKENLFDENRKGSTE